MSISAFEVHGIRAFDYAVFDDLGPVTLLVGPNNSGKSTLLRALATMQYDNLLQPRDARWGSERSMISAAISPAMLELFESRGTTGQGWPYSSEPPHLRTLSYTFHIIGQAPVLRGTLAEGNWFSRVLLSDLEPDAVIVPYLSNRRVSTYSEEVHDVASRTVRLDLGNLTARVDALVSRFAPGHDAFMASVESILHLEIDSISSTSGKTVGVRVGPARRDLVALDALGDGVAQLLGLLVALADASGKVFLIEEIENDIHPKALKALLDLVEERSTDNQFIISTHNNIVLRHLGALPNTSVYEVVREPDTIENVPTSRVDRVSNSVEDRVRLLSDLGYELSDLDIWDGWLVFEESSAEQIVQQFFFKWYFPALQRVRTVSAGGTGNLKATAEAMAKLVLFAHLEPRYRNRFAVIADGDESGRAATRRLSERFPGLPVETFYNLTHADFEEYYPARFKAEVEAALLLKGHEKREAKATLLRKVISWMNEHPEQARTEFEESAAEVVSYLRVFASRFEPH